MKVIIAGTEISLDDKELILARKAVNSFFDSIRAGAAKTNTPSLYVTAVIIAYVKTRDIIDSMTPESMKILMDLAHRTDDAKVLPDPLPSENRLSRHSEGGV